MNFAKAAMDCALFEASETEGDKRLWVVFSHVDVPLGKFAQSNIFQKLEGHKLYLNCEGNSWYTRGIGNLTSDIPTTVKALTELTAGLDVTFVGHSMGAYLSLLCGNYIAGSRFISTSPEPVLGLDESRSKKNGVTASENWADLLSMDFSHNPHPNGLILFGAYDPIDAWFLAQSELDERFGTIREVAHHHGVTEYLTSHGIYADLLSTAPEMIKTWEEQEYLKPRFEMGSAEQYEHFYQTFRLTQKRDWEGAFGLSAEFRDWMHAGYQELRAKILAKTSRNPDALAAAELAYQLQPDVMQFIETYALACLRSGETKRVCQILDSLTPRQRTHRIGQRLIETVHTQLGINFRASLKPSDASSFVSIFKTDNVPSKLDVATNSKEIEEAFSQKKYGEVLSLTGHKREATLFADPEMCRIRGLSLIHAGDVSTGRRLLMRAVAKGKSNAATGRVLLRACMKLKDPFLLQAFLDMALSEKASLALARPAALTLKFLTEPGQIEAILAILVEHKNGIKGELDEVSRKTKSLGCEFQIASGLARRLPDLKVFESNVQALSEWLLRNGLRQSVRDWLDGYEAEAGSKTILKLQNALDNMKPTPTDINMSPTQIVKA